MSLLSHRDPMSAVSASVDPRVIALPTARAVSWRDTGAYQLILLQALVSIVLSYQLLFSPAALIPRAYQEVTILGLLLIPLALSVMPSAVLTASTFAGGLLLFDTVLTSAIIYLSGDVSSDLYLTYFIIILMSASSWQFKQKITLSIVLCAAYGGVLFLAAGPTGALQEGQLIRITILLVMSVFYAVVTKTLHEERQENAALLGYIAERKRADDALRDSEERFRLAVDYAHDAIFYLDGHNVILWANRQAEIVSGQSMDNLLGRTLIAVFSHQPLVKAQLASIDLGRTSSTLLEFEVFLSDGRSMWIEMNATPVQRDGAVVGRLVVARDRTERKGMEHQLRQADKLATLGTLLGGVAHELNNPLFMISGYAQLGAEQLKQGHKEELADHLQAIQEAAQRASAIIQRSLAVARSATGARTPCEVSGVVRLALDLATNDLAIHKIELRSNLPPTPPVLADPQELTQVFLNVINNARQVMVSANGQGVLTVTSTLTEDPPNRWVEVRVVDDGPGISPAHRSRIFEPFFTTKPEGQGTGLGLSICQRIVTDLKGTLTCESEPGQGATFIIRLPVMSRLNT
jgi:PAS domain S-box-containing protein